MNKLIYAILLFTFLLGCKKETNYLVKYNFTYVPDSLNQSIKNSEEMVLITNDSSYIFTTNKYFEMDTLSMIDINDLKVNPQLLSKLDAYDVNYYNDVKLYFKKDSNQYFTHTNLNALKYKFSEDANSIKWNLINDSKKINDYNVKKATTSLYGREWIAWYTENIPVAYGPYKFKDLPGLILELHDSKNQFKFELNSLEVDTTTYATLFTDIETINSTKADFINVTKKYREYPEKITIKTGDSPLKDLEKVEKKKQELKRFNNAIEKDLHFDIK